MALVQLITTGRMEKEALGVSLARLFPEHEFRCPEPLDGFTSARLPPAPLATNTPINLDRFASRLIAAYDPGNRRDRPRPDYVIGIEDVELLNADEPARITAALRDTLQRRLDAWPGGAQTVERIRDALAERVSFHLMAPMTEALFFADADALARATAPAPDRVNRFDADTCDVEAFDVDDPDYLGAAEDPQSRWCSAGLRQGHPKRYLLYLTDPGSGGRYRETVHGAAALRDLAWSRVTIEPRRTRFARSLLADLADMLGSEGPSGETHPLTWPPPRGAILRNL